ncbi:hypothetical protein PMZ80_009309 [Knufia obscura]|uniref:Major facilitator superfamily (MFS) profile domain-containing protein n=2 Tax=Knufia TaxID=430999 RepID=A0AAN8ETZ0_9EURO|nr:hypothetical protein PMZ80_009309 [Knufia obscura]KAK5955770.1 hypothetical protein OHC33_003411 [Knufia fluminis]
MVKPEQDADGGASVPVNVLDWNGKDDPDNPRNFTLGRRIASTAAVTFLAFVSTLGGAIYAPAHEDVSNQFSVSDEVAILPLALYNVGLAFGPLFGAPLCETFGRKVVFLTTTPLFALFILGSGFAQSAASLIICRFFAGVFASPAISNASATIVDYTAGRYRAVSLAFYYSIPFFGAVLGPLIGGFLVELKGWRWTQWTTLFFIVAFYVPTFFTRETYKKTILQRRAKRQGLVYPTAQRTASETIKYFTTTLFLRPIHMILTEPIVTLVCLYNGFMFGLLYAMVVASPWIFQHYYNFDLTGQSLSFLGLIIGTLLAPVPLVIIDLYMYQPRLKRWKASQQPSNQDITGESRFPPENRLFPAMLGSFLLPASLLAFAWTARPSIHYIVPIIFQGLSILFSLIIYASANLFMLDAYGPLYGASAAGAAMLSRYSLSAAFPMFALQMYKGLGVGWATTILACCTAAMAPIPWCFWKWGEGLRGRMKYESSA